MSVMLAAGCVGCVAPSTGGVVLAGGEERVWTWSGWCAAGWRGRALCLSRPQERRTGRDWPAGLTRLMWRATPPHAAPQPSNATDRARPVLRGAGRLGGGGSRGATACPGAGGEPSRAAIPQPVHAAGRRGCPRQRLTLPQQARSDCPGGKRPAATSPRLPSASLAVACALIKTPTGDQGATGLLCRSAGRPPPDRPRREMRQTDRWLYRTSALPSYLPGHQAGILRQHQARGSQPAPSLWSWTCWPTSA